MVLYTIKLCQKQLGRSLVTVNLKVKKQMFLLRVQKKIFFAVAFLVLEIA